MNIIMLMIVMFYALFPKRLKALVMQYEVVQPKESYAWEEIETSHENYFAGMTVVEMKYHEH